MTTVATSRPAAHGRWHRRLGTVLIVAGIAVLAWAFVVWKWNDPFTSLYTRWEQRGLESELAALTRSWPTLPPPATLPSRPEEDVRQDARRLRSRADPGRAIGRLRVPRLGLDMVVVEGTDSGSLKKGPGRDARTFMPGEGKLVYVAGHRTTYGAPFAHIDRLRSGDRMTIEMPYGTFAYEVARRRIVDDEDLSVLAPGPNEELALQACHPRFFASQRYIVWARPLRGITVEGRRYALPQPITEQ